MAGTVTIGGQSRIVTQFEDEELQVYYLFDIVNAAPAPVKTASPLVFELPSGASNATLLEGSTPNAVAKGSSVMVPGPFAARRDQRPDRLSRCRRPRSVTIRQKLPVAMDQVAVMVEKVGADGGGVAAADDDPRRATSGGKQFVLGTRSRRSRRAACCRWTSTACRTRPPGRATPRSALGFLTLVAGAWGAVAHRRSVGGGGWRAQHLEAAARAGVRRAAARSTQRRQAGEVGRAEADERRERPDGRTRANLRRAGHGRVRAPARDQGLGA